MIAPPLIVLWLLRSPVGAPVVDPSDPPGAFVPVQEQPVPVGPIRQSPRDAWFAEDKVRHLAMSFFTVAATQAAGRAAGLGADAATAAGGAVGVAAGIGKELYDSRDHGLFSVRDLVWDAAGIVLAVLFVREVR